MPATLPEWAFFAFFVIGSLGGWVLLSVLAYDLWPHVLKHTGTTWLLRDGVDLWDVSGLTSTSTKTLEGVYGHHSPDYQKASAKAFRRKA